MDPRTGQTWGALSKAHEVPYQATIGSFTGTTYNWGDFDALKALYFGPSKRGAVFHYALFCNNFDGARKAAGRSRDYGAVDFLVALGQFQGITDLGMAGTFMHEFGHNLNLRHGAMDGNIVSWTWDFGDGTTASGPMVAHTYSAPGDYFATLTVIDAQDRINLVPLLSVVTVPAGILGNISTRAQVGIGDNVPIGGFILQGTEPKRVLLRAIGPSLTSFGVSGALADPTIALHDAAGALIAQNDNWKTTVIGGAITADQVAELEGTSIPPISDAESAIVTTLDPGAYTAIVAGANDTTGIGLVEIYDLGPAAIPTNLANISTRGLVQTGDNVMIGGFIIGNQTTDVLVRAIGPSLADFGVSGALADPTLELHDGNGALLASNDNWRSDQETEIEATTLAPNDNLESAILRNLGPGAYTAIVRGVGDSSGIGLVEAYRLD